MSLINQMLQDLDARRAAHGVGSHLPNDVRPLPKETSSRWPLILGLLAFAALVGGSYLAYRAEIEKLLVPVESLTVSPASSVSPVVVVPPVPLGQVAETIPSSAPTPVTTLALDGIDPSLRFADSMQSVGEAVSPTALPEAPPPLSAPEKTLPDKKPPPLAQHKAEVEPAPPTPAAKSPEPPPAQNTVNDTSPTVEKPPRPPVIERTVAAGTPRERVEAEYRKALTAVNQGRAPDAIDSLHSALRQDSLHAASRQLLVKLLIENRQAEEAIKVLRDGLAGQPAQIGWAMSLARLQVEQGDLAAASQTLDYSSPAAANNADYLGFSGNVLQRLGRQREAAEQYLKATRIAPADGRWWLGLGLTLEAQGQVSEAKEAFLRARQGANLGPELQALVEQKLR